MLLLVAGSTGSQRRSMWVGRLVGSPEAWFVVWATSRRAAVVMLENDLGAVDRASLKRLSEGGSFLFRTRADVTGALAPSEGERVLVRDPAARTWIEATARSQRAPYHHGAS